MIKCLDLYDMLRLTFFEVVNDGTVVDKSHASSESSKQFSSLMYGAVIVNRCAIIIVDLSKHNPINQIVTMNSHNLLLSQMVFFGANVLVSPSTHRPKSISDDIPSCMNDSAPRTRVHAISGGF